MRLRKNMIDVNITLQIFADKLVKNIFKEKWCLDRDPQITKFIAY